MSLYFRIACIAVFMFWSLASRAQEAPVGPTSATDHKVRIHKVKRINADANTSEHHGHLLRKRRVPGSAGTAREVKVYKRQRHFADKDIKGRSRSRVARKEALGVGTE
jgi:hypothetical protein